jgi:hypothetical protein
MKKVRTPSQIKVKMKNQATRPTAKDSIIQLPKVKKQRKVKKIGSKLDEFEIESIKLQ